MSVFSRIRRWFAGPAVDPTAQREADCAKPAATCRDHGASDGIEVSLVTNFHTIREQVDHGLLVEHGGREDPRARRVARDLANGQPLTARDRTRRVQPEGTATDRLPQLA